MTTSSDDESTAAERKPGKLIDIRDRLPPVLRGSDNSCNIGVAILKAIIENDHGNAHEWFAGLMMASHTLQRMLRDKDKVDVQQMQSIFATAMEIADTTKINIDFKGEPPKGTG